MSGAPEEWRDTVKGDAPHATGNGWSPAIPMVSKYLSGYHVVKLFHLLL